MVSLASAHQAGVAPPLNKAPPPVDGFAHSTLGSTFRPEFFFSGRTEGGGVVRNPFGQIMRRCSIVTLGAWNEAKHAVEFDETFTYDDGEVDHWRWVVTPGRDGRYLAAESLVGAGVPGFRQGRDYALNFRRPVGALSGVLAPTFHTRFSPISPDLVLKSARLTLLGLPIGSMTAVHRQVCH